MRVKNVAQGYFDSTGFHPIRSSVDYDPDRAGDDYSQRPRRRKARKTSAKKAKARKHAKRTVKRAPQRKATKRGAARQRNPIPTKWVAAKVKRIGRDLQVALFPKKSAARKRRTTRAKRRR